ncbi:class I SAM-dependent methyltransferase [Desulforhopalus singaporensis]|uniref:Methyltransferase, FkbM family n=1 Tax=Desulforhopalus singaporensis TaxID=91360 RepID=A0A1H0JNI0_9BACT|nr:class I SAM-dependent methyltransferase [Desulforhopalus singaporensis]SDO45102.1 methyltransferase, FkbM family [Desulforhopalus singaporensis]
MVPSTPAIYQDIDWAALRQNAMARKAWKSKGPEQWDAKAKSFNSRNRKNDYVDLFLSHLPKDDSCSVLDIGCGPGTLAIPIARRARRVTAVDFSPEMLKILERHAEEEGLDNITTVCAAWEDDWRDYGIDTHDIAIASRSMGVYDLHSALKKIDAISARYVFLTDRAGATPFDEGAFEAIGRPFEPGPDYIYTVNVLYTMGIYANVSILEIDKHATFNNLEDAFASYAWMFQDLSPEEQGALRDYVKSRVVRRGSDHVTVKRKTPIRWALVWWEKPKNR